MALDEKVTHDDLILYEVLKNPVLCGEFIQNLDRLEHEDIFEFTDYQKDFICDFGKQVSIACGRAVGKTVSLSNIIIWALINNIFPGDYVVYTVPSKVHLDPVFTTLTRMFRSNSLLKNYLQSKKGINSSDFTINLLNNATLLCRIAGQSGTGANVIGLHTPFILLDESGYYPWGTWLELQPTRNTWTPGSRIITSGVPTGLRETNVLYYTDMIDSNYTKHRISAYDNPRFTKEDEDRALIQYGGKDSEDFTHFIMGRHGKPLYSLFDRSLFKIESYPVYKLKINGLKMSGDISEYITKIRAIPDIDGNPETIIGIDLGYTEPTAIVVMYKDRHGRFKFHCRVELKKVAYPIQEIIIDTLDSKFTPFKIGIDKGSSGISVIQNLNSNLKYGHKKYDDIIVPVDFSSSIVIGIDADGSEIKSKTKPFSTSILQDYSNNHKIIYSSTDTELITELERMTYTKTPSGDIVYKTLTQQGGLRGEDHFTSAMLCFAMSNYLYTDYLNIRGSRKLAKPQWVY